MGDYTIFEWGFSSRCGVMCGSEAGRAIARGTGARDVAAMTDTSPPPVLACHRRFQRARRCRVRGTSWSSRARRRRRRHRRRRARRARVDGTRAPASLPRRCEGRGGRTQPPPASSRPRRAWRSARARALAATGRRARGAARRATRRRRGGERQRARLVRRRARRRDELRRAARSSLQRRAPHGVRRRGVRRPDRRRRLRRPLALGDHIAIFGRGAGSLCDLQVRVEPV